MVPLLQARLHLVRSRASSSRESEPLFPRRRLSPSPPSSPKLGNRPLPALFGAESGFLGRVWRAHKVRVRLIPELLIKTKPAWECQGLGVWNELPVENILLFLFLFTL